MRERSRPSSGGLRPWSSDFTWRALPTLLLALVVGGRHVFVLFVLPFGLPRFPRSTMNALRSPQLQRGQTMAVIDTGTKGRAGARDSRSVAWATKPARGRRDVVLRWLAGVPCVGSIGTRTVHAVTGSARADDSMLQLFDWVRRHGGVGLDSIEVRTFRKGGQEVRGIAATRDLPVQVDPASGTTYARPLFSIPKAVILHAEHPTVLSSPFGEEEGLTAYSRVLGFLAVERRLILGGGQSFWAPYIRTLPTPRDFAQFHPLYAGKDFLDQFAGLPVVENIKRLLREWKMGWEDDRRQWTSLANRAGIDDFDFKDVLWASTVLLSRRYRADWTRPALVPVSDLVNCDLRPNVWYRSGRLDGDPPSWRVEAIQSLRKGDEIVENYQRDAANSVYFSLYGFLFPDNPRRMEPLDASTCLSLSRRPMPTGGPLASSFQALIDESCRA